MAYAGHEGSQGGSGLPEEIAFLQAFGIDRLLLGWAVRAAERTGVTADLILLSEGHVSATYFYTCLARHLGVPYLEQALPLRSLPAPKLVAGLEIAPLEPNPAGLAFVMAPRGATLRLLLQCFGRGEWQGQGRVAITKPQRLAALERASRWEALARQASDDLDRRYAAFSARTPLNGGQALALAGSIGLSALALCVAPAPAAAVIGLICSLPFLAVIVIRLLAMAASPPLTPRRGARRRDIDLPVYTVVVALHREAGVVRDLVTALKALDYPALCRKRNICLH